MLWQRLDRVGQDACRFLRTDTGWTIEGTAVFDQGGAPACIGYRLDCDPAWQSRSAEVRGWIGGHEVSRDIRRGEDGRWQVNGIGDDRLSGLCDIDLGFTPASNTNAIRRLSLPSGAEAGTEAVWLDADDWEVKPLRQTYRRVAERLFDYASPLHGYAARLEVDAFGAVTDYPDLWRATNLMHGLTR
jgi:hypothetical protein